MSEVMIRRTSPALCWTCNKPLGDDEVTTFVSFDDPIPGAILEDGTVIPAVLGITATRHSGCVA